jgi:hypothetical protein
MTKWSNFFSIPDPTLVSDGSVDPMGMQLIWTYFGQLIFQNKLTSVSSDVRNYTVNLLHHFVLYKFCQERNEDFVSAQKNFTSYSSTYDAKAGMLMFMEDLLVFALMDQKSSVNTFGLLGSNKAQEVLDRAQGNYSQIEIHADRSKGVLVRQIQLGVNGRYKGPFMNMGLMTKNFEYTPKEFERVEMLFNQWNEGSALVDKLLDLLSDLLKGKQAKYPIVQLEVLKSDSDLWRLYARCFGQVKLNNSLQLYWLEKLGVNSGAAKAVFAEVHNYGEQPVSAIIATAFMKEVDVKEKEILQWVLDLEPFLSRCAHAFYLLADVKTKRVNDIQNDLDLLVTNFPLESVLPLASQSERLGFLVECVKDKLNSGVQFANGILQYHKKIMEDRGGMAWVELDGDNLKHYINQSSNVSTSEVVNGGFWYNRYYLDALRSIHNGLNQE